MSHTWTSEQPLRIVRTDSAGMDFTDPRDEKEWVRFMKKCGTLARRCNLTYGTARNLTYTYFRPLGRPVQIVRRAIAAGIFQVVQASRKKKIKRGRVIVRGPDGELRFEEKSNAV